MRYAVYFIVVLGCALGLWAAASPAQAGPKEVCEQGALYLDVGLRLLLVDPKTDAIIRGCSEVVRRDRKAAWAYLARGVAYYDKGVYDRAIADISKSIKLSPSVHAYYERAIIYRSRGDFDRATDDYSAAVRLAPHSRLLIERGELYRARGDQDHAIADYSEVIRLAASIAAHFARGEAYEAKGDRGKAIEDYAKALSISAESKSDRDTQTEAAKRLAALQPAPPAAASPGRRVALVIGNSAYAAIERLANPANDARAVAASFRRLGFAEVVERYDLSLAAMVDAFKAFGDKSAHADWAIVYYAGHGIEVGGITYLVPTDARLLRDTHVADEALPLDRVLAKVEAARKLRLVILDACRTNPFAVRMARSAGSGRSVGRGLARIEPDRGVIVAYAAKHGTIAQDGPAGHSPFTEALLHHLEEPDLEINFLFRKVRDRVLARTGRAQEPFVYGSLGSERLYFNGRRRR